MLTGRTGAFGASNWPPTTLYYLGEASNSSAEQLNIFSFSTNLATKKRSWIHKFEWLNDIGAWSKTPLLAKSSGVEFVWCQIKLGDKILWLLVTQNRSWNLFWLLYYHTPFTGTLPLRQASLVLATHKQYSPLLPPAYWGVKDSFKNVWRFSSRSTSLYFSTRFLVRFKPDFA